MVKFKNRFSEMVSDNRNKSDQWASIEIVLFCNTILTYWKNSLLNASTSFSFSCFLSIFFIVSFFFHFFSCLLFYYSHSFPSPFDQLLTKQKIDHSGLLVGREERESELINAFKSDEDFGRKERERVKESKKKKSREGESA